MELLVNVFLHVFCVASVVGRSLHLQKLTLPRAGNAVLLIDSNDGDDDSGMPDIFASSCCLLINHNRISRFHDG